LRHLTHELRQPLSGIESIAYYLEMVLDGGEPRVLEQCDRLRQMVRQANWLLEDTALGLRLGETCEAAALDAAFEELGARLALDEERTIELRTEDALPLVWVPTGLLEPFCAHLVNFFLLVTRTVDPLVVTLWHDAAGVQLTLEANVEEEGPDALRMINAPEPGSAVNRFLAACGGQAHYTAEGERVRAVLQLVAVE
jgi:signal transduction histidine kinase